MTPWTLVALALAAGNGWVDGPQAPTSTAPLPPAVAPRDGEPGERPTETLVVPERPPEDRRVDVDDGLMKPLPDLRLRTAIDRRAMTSGAVLDLDTFLQTSAIAGLVWLPSSAGAARPVSRGHDAGAIGLVVDDVPIVDGFGLVTPTELISLVGAASLTFQHGARAFSPTTSTGGVLEVDTGGDLADMGETARTDGLLAAGIGGADLEKGATTLLRTGWRSARVIGHATILHRDDQRPGRSIAGIPARASSTDVVDGSGGAGGTAGVRVDLVPFSSSRLFVSWLAGRGVDVPDPSRCGDVDQRGRARDCVRATERGLDVGIVGFDIVRDVGDVVVAPRARFHLQRALSYDERAGVDLARVDTARDEVVRGGVSLGAAVRPRHALAWSITPSADVAVDLFADRASSQFVTRSLTREDGEPPAGLAQPERARVDDDAVARQGLVRARWRLDHALWSLEAGTRLSLSHVDDADDDGRARVAPSVDLAARVHVTDVVDTFVAVGSVATGHAAVVTGAGFDDVAAGNTFVVDDRFVEVGVAARHAAVDVDAVVYGALRDSIFVPAATGVGIEPTPQTDGVVGVEGSVGLKPDLDGLLLRATLGGVVVDRQPFSVGAAAKPGVIQPQAALLAHWRPATQPFGLYARLTGALPQARLSATEQEDPTLCPERAIAGALDDAVCSGAAGFAIVDVGAYVQLGQLRFDVGGDNLLDQQGTWRGAVLGSGGAAARARIAFLF